MGLRGTINTIISSQLPSDLDAQAHDVVDIGKLGIGTSNPAGSLEVVTDGVDGGVASTGGSFRIVAGDYAPNVIAGCANNAINDGASSCVIAGGGYNNNAGYNAANVINGADTRYAVIAGGYDNTLEGIVSAILGGAHHEIGPDGADDAAHCTITGGSYCIITGGDYSTITGGSQHSILNSSGGSTIGGGYNNDIGSTAAAKYSAIGGGFGNNIGGSGTDYTCSVICGGRECDTGTASYASVLGGIYCDATGDYSSCLGGHSSVASGQASLAWGRRAQAQVSGSVALADWTNADFINSTANSFAGRFAGGWNFLGAAGIKISYDSDTFASMVCQANGDLKIFDDAVDVGDTTDGHSLFVYRKAAEGDDYIRIYVSQYKSATISSSSNLVFESVGYQRFKSDGDVYLDVGNNDRFYVRGDSGAGSNLLTIVESSGDATFLGSVIGKLRTTTSVPSSATAAGTAGDIAADSNYIYVCTATNTWKRVAISSW